MGFGKKYKPQILGFKRNDNSSNEEKSQEIGIKAREKVVREFDSQVVVWKYVKLYEEILK